jgi:DNA anti-recombination protein RmuC
MQKAVSQIDTNIKAVTSDEAAFRQGLLARMDTYERTVMKPVDTLGGVVTSLQETMGNTITGLEQNMGTVVKGLQETVTSVGSQITQISVQAEKIATLGLKYEEAQKLTKDIHSILVGSYTKGKAGEEALRTSLSELAKMGYVTTKQPIHGGVVEYAISFKDGTLVAIDSKVVSTDEVSDLVDEKIAAEDRARLADKIRKKVRDKIPEVQKYVDPPRTLPFAIMCVPDSVMDLVNEVIPEAVQKNIILLGYSAVPQLVGYFVRIHGFYAIQEDVEELRDRISKAQQEASRLDETFFANRFDKPLGTLNKALSVMKEAASRIRDALDYQAEHSHEQPLQTTVDSV